MEWFSKHGQGWNNRNTLYSYIREVLGSNVDRGTGYTH
jgi:hypothetical protein